MPEFEEYLAFATTVALKAGQAMLAGQTSLRITHKTDQTPVTQIDEAINHMVIAEVQKLYPAHGVRGEEASHNSEAELLWVCDPIDGTAAYIMNIPMSAFSLALVRNGEPIVAVVYNPWVNKLYTAIKGEGSHCNGVPLHVSERSGSQVRITTRGVNTHNGPLGTEKAGNLLREKKWNLVPLAGIVFRACLIAEGSLDGTYYSHIGAHDVAALSLIVTEAGGKVTDLNGNPQPYNKDINGAVISNGVIHDELAAFLKKLDIRIK